MRATIDLNAVVAFVRVADAGSFTAAARQLGLPKSAVSRRVASLEAALGVQLLQRTTRRTTLTDEGARYHREAADALVRLSDAGAAASGQERDVQGIVRFTAPPDLASAYLVEPLARFVEQNPRVHVELTLTTSVVDLVDERIDFALRAGRLRDSALVVRRIAATPLVLAAAPSYIDRHGAPQAPEDLARHDCVLFRPESGRARWTLTGPGGEERTITVSGRLGADDFDFVRTLALRGAGIALLPWQGCLKSAGAPTLTHVLPEWRGPTGALSIVHAAARHVPRRVALLRDYLYDHLRVALGGDAALPSAAE